MSSWEPSKELSALALLTCALFTWKQWLKAWGGDQEGWGVDHCVQGDRVERKLD